MPTQADLDNYYRLCLSASGTSLARAGAGAVQNQRAQVRIETLSNLGAINVLPSDLRVLDVGAGNGTFLNQLGDKFLKFAIEPSNEAAAILRSRGTEVYSSWEEPITAGEFFDLVVLSSVLEHFAQPEFALRKVQSLMGTHALLWLVVPDSRFPRQTLGEFYGFEHVVHFTPRSLGRLVRKTGMEILGQKTMPDGALLMVAQKSSSPNESQRDPETETVESQLIRVFAKYQDDKTILSERVERAFLQIEDHLELGRKVWIWGAGQHTAALLSGEAGLDILSKISGFVDSGASAVSLNS
jgi:SAM-dependent methyltransferase